MRTGDLRQTENASRRIIVLLLACILPVSFAIAFIDSFRSAARASGTNLYIIGSELMDAGAYREASEVLGAAVRMNPNNAYVLFEFGKASHLAGAEATALRAWAKATELDPALEKDWETADLVRPPKPAPRSEVHDKLLKAARAEWERRWRPFDELRKN